MTRLEALALEEFPCDAKAVCRTQQCVVPNQCVHGIVRAMVKPLLEKALREAVEVGYRHGRMFGYEYALPHIERHFGLEDEP